jgi:hypothetical protein
MEISLQNTNFSVPKIGFIWPKYIYRGSHEAYFLIGEEVSPLCFSARWYYTWSSFSHKCNLFFLHIVLVERGNKVIKEATSIYLKQKGTEKTEDKVFFVKTLRNKTEFQFYKKNFTSNMECDYPTLQYKLKS